MAEEWKAKCIRVHREAWNEGNLDALDELHAADLVVHWPPFPDIEGLKAWREFAANMRIAFPDLQATTDEIIVEGDTYAARWATWGTHTAQSPAMPIPPTGKQMTVTMCGMGHIVEGKIVEEWLYSDNLGLFQQLGVIPPLG